MPGPHLIEPAFPGDDGGADPGLSAVLAAYGEGRRGEHAVLALLSGVRLLVPVVALPRGRAGGAEPGDARADECEAAGTGGEMVLPTLIGADGRRGVLAFTSAETMARWRPEARPVPVRAAQACRAAVEDGADAVVIDVAGPVPFAVEGDPLRVLAGGGAPPAAHQDPDVLAAVEAVCAAEPGVGEVRVGPGAAAELSVRFTVDRDPDDLDDLDGRDTARRVADRLAERLRGRGVGGVELGVVRAHGERRPVTADE